MQSQRPSLLELKTILRNTKGGIREREPGGPQRKKETDNRRAVSLMQFKCNQSLSSSAKDQGFSLQGTKDPHAGALPLMGDSKSPTAATPSRVDPGVHFQCRAVCSENGWVLLGCLCLGWGDSCFGGSGQSGKGEQSHSQC